MSDIGRILYTAKDAIISNLTAINVTGSNISNISTPGYTRLRPLFESVGTREASSNQEQIGVKIADIQRVYDKFLGSQIVAQDSAVGSATARKSLLTQIEGIVNESAGNGINDALSKFWSAWGNLSVNPSGKTERDVLVTAAKNLTDILNSRSAELYSVQSSIDQTIADDVDKLNGYFNEMSVLNGEIARIEGAGAQASSLRDNRTTLLSKISSIIDISYMERSDGSLYIYLPASGKTLVEGTNKWQLTVQSNSANANLNDIVFTDDLNSSLNNDITGGELGGLLNVRDVVLDSYIDKLNQTTASIINKVNTQHMAGYDQDGNIGGAFFTATTNPTINMTEAKNIQVSAAIIADVRKIAASSTVNSDGDNATAMAVISEDKMYASLGQISITTGTGSAAGLINNIGQAYKNTTSAIELTRGATSARGDWTIANNGGFTAIQVLSADDNSLTLDLNGNGTADITLSLSGSWASGDTLAFSLSKRDSTTNIEGYFNAFIAGVGQDVFRSATELAREQAVANQRSDQREALSGVSLDEEMLNLIKYQMAYNAAGRLTKVVSDMMDVLITLGR